MSRPATAAERVHAFMQAWDSGSTIATAMSHGDGLQTLSWDDLAAILEVAEMPERMSRELTHLARAQQVADAIGCCGHKASEHGDDGCLNGWSYAEGIYSTEGCQCKMRGMADR